MQYALGLFNGVILPTTVEFGAEGKSLKWQTWLSMCIQQFDCDVLFTSMSAKSGDPFLMMEVMEPAGQHRLTLG